MNHADLARECAAIARTAGAAIMRIYDADYTIARKDDASPLTAADLAAHHAIVDGLAELTPQIPVLSEESAEQAAWSERRGWARYWLVDPLDGTREFIKHNGEFTVNIALIEDGAPTLGVVYAPALDEMYLAWQGGHAYAQTPQHGIVAISTRARMTPLIVAGSRSHADPRMLTALDKLGTHELISLGSSLKFCRTAQGEADLYVRYGLTSEWDTAAGQCVLEQAGGGVTRLDGSRLTYNTKESLLNPDFLAFGDKAVDWAALLRDGSADE
ncbi:3'(2'),5'-bisphosphate nucleotidase CysQ [Rudaea cellulosilytica]|uniref:3'(2'),5'-bisphosphate nucleotidase CysQ n=1 Tax=Rudaea cellulosilytica TaxID=540746 RepID=UPI00035E5EC6|nr:3'(2'),5'-bisphosphate nucleotidase CysQ [Rudaea cellulosilytica]